MIPRCRHAGSRRGNGDATEATPNSVTTSAPSRIDIVRAEVVARSMARMKAPFRPASATQ